MYQVGENGLNLIKKWEGFRANAYQDVVGIWTIGYGTIRWQDGSKVQEGDTITMEDATAYLEYQVQEILDEVIPYIITAELNQNQVDAISSLMYNIGGPNFINSTLLKKINAGDMEGAADEFMKWVYAGKKKIQGLVNRRSDERELFLNPLLEFTID